MTKTRQKKPATSVEMRVDALELRVAIEKANRAVSTKTALPILTCVLLEKGYVTGTNMDTTIRTACGMEGGPLSVCVPAPLLLRCAKQLRGEVRMVAGDGKLTLADGRVTYALNTWPGSDFPHVGLTDVAFTQSVPVDDWRWIWRRVRTSYTRDASRPILEGVYLTFKPRVGLTAVATDSYRLVIARRKLKSHKTQRALVAGAALALLEQLAKGIENIKVAISGEHVVFAVGDSTLTTRVIFGDYPRYEQLLPEDAGKTAVVDRRQLVDAVDAMAPASARNAPLRLDFNGDLGLRLQSADVGEATARIASEGEADLEIGVDLDFLRDGLRIMEGETVAVCLRSPLKPLVLSETDCQYLLMPIRLSDGRGVGVVAS